MKTVVILLVCTAAIMRAALAADEPAATITVQEMWSAFYGGKDQVFHVIIRSPKPVNGRLGWALSVGGRVIERKECEVAGEANRDVTTELRLHFPETKPGVIFPARLTVSLLGEVGNQSPTAEVAKPMWIYPEDAFAGRDEWLKGLKLVLFDPGKKTAERLDKANIPFARAVNVDALPGPDCGLLLIGEGVSFHDYRGLPETLIKIVAQGVPVLCLAPGGGEIPIPGAEGLGGSHPVRVVLESEGIIAMLDKRLDSTAWPPDANLIRSRIVLKGERGLVVGAVEQGAGMGWPWIEMTFEKKSARLLICGFAIVEKWESGGPTPPALLLKMLERLSTGSQATGTRSE